MVLGIEIAPCRPGLLDINFALVPTVISLLVSLVRKMSRKAVQAVTSGLLQYNKQPGGVTRGTMRLLWSYTSKPLIKPPLVITFLISVFKTP